MADQPTLPELTTAPLDAATLAQLFADLDACTTVLEVRLKSSAARRAGAPTTLDEAHEALSSGDAYGVQVRYLWDGRAWIDTLIRGSEGVRITRMTVPEP